MKVALIGASGNVGVRLTNELLSRGHEVTAIARHPEKIEARPHLTAKAGDVADPAGLAALVAGHDAAFLSVRYQGLDVAKLIEGMRASGVKRWLIVGGAASLEVSPGVQLVDTPGFPDFIKVEALPARDALNVIRQITDLDWTFLSPAIMLVPGERTGTFRLGGDQLMTAESGPSTISMEDLSVALVDELEQPRHIRQRFSIAY